MLCLALILSALAPARALALAAAPDLLLAIENQCSSSAQTKSEESLADCCQVNHHSCCCQPAPVQPKNLDGAASGSQTVKFIGIKGSGRPIPTLAALAPATRCTGTNFSPTLPESFLNERPLYLLKRALLI